MKPQLILLGAPGSGKGTQAARILENYDYKHISTGDLLRAEVAKKSELGLKITDLMENGKLVDDATVLELLKNNCDLEANAYIFDGFPRNIDQAKALDDVVLKGVKSVAISLELDLNELVARITNRRSCTGCGEIYNLISKKPSEEGKCDKCSAALMQRKDDNEETVQNRVGVFKSTIGPVLEYYKEKGILKTVDASIDPETTFNQVKEAIDS